MRISAKVEDACLAMLELAANYGSAQPVRVKTVADTHGIPQRFLVQILLHLKGAGLVNSIRGASGGYQLARPPEDISLADIIGAIDHSALAPVRRMSPKRRGPVSLTNSAGAQSLHSVWRDLHAEEVRLLNATTLADLVRRSQQDMLSYQI
jgi:Rrf2 family cysteine metabolism transcriptional repressor